MLEPKTLPASHGWLWVLHGFALFRAYPAFWLLLLLFYWMALLMIGTVPVVGAWIATILIPGLAAGFMVACDAAQRKSPPLPAHLFLPFRRAARAQLTLGVIYLVCLALLLAVSALADGGQLFRVMLIGVKLNDPALQSPEVGNAALIALLLYTPVMLAFWFAPALSYWQGMDAVKALFFSFFAGFRNTKAFLVYGLGWLLFGGVVPLVLATILGLFVPRDVGGAKLIAFLLAPYMMVVVCAMILSFYSSFVAVFGAPGTPGTPGATPPAAGGTPPKADTRPPEASSEPPKTNSAEPPKANSEPPKTDASPAP